MTEKESKNKTTLVCPHNKRFESIFVCAINCPNRCQQYLDNVDLAILEEFISLHPEYEIKGELMATTKTDSTAKKVKHYWTIDDEGKVEEVSEQDIIDNPQEYFEKEIWDKPPYQYEIVIALKRKK